MIKRRPSRGDLVVYRKLKCTPRPGPRAADLSPSPHGEDYVYYVDKFWVVEDCDDDTIVVLTRRGKRHYLQRDDPRLRRPSLWERIRYGAHFPKPAVLHATSSPHA